MSTAMHTPKKVRASVSQHSMAAAAESVHGDAGAGNARVQPVYVLVQAAGGEARYARQKAQFSTARRPKRSKRGDTKPRSVSDRLASLETSVAKQGKALDNVRGRLGEHEKLFMNVVISALVVGICFLIMTTDWHALFDACLAPMRREIARKRMERIVGHPLV